MLNFVNILRGLFCTVMKWKTFGVGYCDAISVSFNFLNAKTIIQQFVALLSFCELCHTCTELAPKFQHVIIQIILLIINIILLIKSKSAWNHDV